MAPTIAINNQTIANFHLADSLERNLLPLGQALLSAGVETIILQGGLSLGSAEAK